MHLMTFLCRMGSICRNQDDDVWETNPKSLDIMEVESVVMPDGASWLGTQDHSKWVSSLPFSYAKNSIYVFHSILLIL